MSANQGKRKTVLYQGSVWYRARMKEFLFRLEQDEDGWPPFAVEGLWCEPEGNLHRLRTFPLFVKGVAYDDLLRVDTDVTGDVTRYQVMKPSGNSTMWLIISEQSLRERVLAELNDLGCGITEGPEAFETLAAVNIQPHVRLSEIDSVLDPLIEKGVVAVAYPALRHSDQ